MPGDMMLTGTKPVSDPLSLQTGTTKKSASDFLADDYLARLLSLSVDAISKEPEALRNQKAALKQEVLETALTHYQGFIEAASCFQEISGHVKQLKKELTSLSECLDSLQEQATSFGVTANEYKEKREAHQLLVAQHSTMLDILEVPQLIDTCVRNSSYDEALDLLALMAKLTVVAGGTSVVKRLASEAAEARKGLQKQLLGRLGQSVTLPECLRCVSYLRRLSAYSESDLRLQFLMQRDLWFKATLSEIDDSSVPDYIRQYTDAHRVHIFDIIMQFRAIFYDASDATTTADSTAPAVAGTAGTRTGVAASADVIRGGTSPVLASWAHRCMEAFVERLDALLPTVQDGSTLATLIEACMYCGRSLSRVGLDFRGLLERSVARAAHGLFHHHIVRAVALFSASVEGHRWVQLPVPKPDPGAAEGALSRSGRATATDALAEATAKLMAHAPLAVLANAVIIALNAARSIALASTRAACGRDLHEAIRDACTVLVHVPSSRELSTTERAAHLAACKCMLDTLAPLISTLFVQVYGGVLPTQLDVAQATAALTAHVAERSPASGGPAGTGDQPRSPSKGTGVSSPLATRASGAAQPVT